jgi:hypothetical protein
MSAINFQIWRAKQGQWILLGCSMRSGGFISISGLWGISQAQRVAGLTPVFEDESSGTFFYMKDKGKNWNLFKALCPDLAEFEFWDENEHRIGTFEQEKFLYEQGMSNARYIEKLEALEGVGLKEVDITKATGTHFPPSYMGEKYLYGTLDLALPMPNDLQLKFKQIAKKEEA